MPPQVKAAKILWYYKATPRARRWLSAAESESPAQQL
jgi:hypothetical protein